MYLPKEWNDLPNEDTPITADDMNHIEQGISDSVPKQIENLDKIDLNQLAGRDFVFGYGNGLKNAPYGLSVIGSCYVIHQRPRTTLTNIAKQSVLDLKMNNSWNRTLYNDVWTDWSLNFDTSNNSILKNSTGYQKLASGLIIQWGFAEIPANVSSITLVFPVAFTFAGRTMVNAVNRHDDFYSTGSSASQVVINKKTINSQTSSFHWISIGY